jgi:luciferase family oxidoreductase group 1
MAEVKLSILDQSVGRAGVPQDASIRHTLELAAHCDALGFHRFWVSEHHNLPTVVGSAPEVLMAAIAARTRRIRIGSAGVMLPHYSALKVAEQFRVLEALAPGRIDLGVGRAPGGDLRTARLLRPQTGTADDFPRQVLELQAWVSGQPMPPGHPGEGVAALPTGPTTPHLWMLGSSGYGAQLAAHYGLPYAFAWFITDGEGAQEALAMYRHQFRPGLTDRPYAALCVWALAADTEDEAWFQFRSRERTRIDRLTGQFGEVLPPAEAARDYTPAEAAHAQDLRRRSFVGTGEQVRDGLLALAHEVGADELVVITWTWDPSVQRRSCELLARAFGLAATPAA